MKKDFDLQEYLTEGVEKTVSDALKASLSNPKESAFMLKFAAAAKALPDINAEKEKTAELQNTYGFHLFTDSFCSTLPCQIKFGKLNFSGSLSKINNPLISNYSSPFHSRR